MYEVEFIPANWIERSVWAAAHGDCLMACSYPILIERRWGERRGEARPGTGRRVDDKVRLFESLNLAALLGSITNEA